MVGSEQLMADFLERLKKMENKKFECDEDEYEDVYEFHLRISKYK